MFVMEMASQNQTTLRFTSSNEPGVCFVRVKEKISELFSDSNLLSPIPSVKREALNDNGLSRKYWN